VAREEAGATKRAEASAQARRSGPSSQGLRYWWAAWRGNRPCGLAAWRGSAARFLLLSVRAHATARAFAYLATIVIAVCLPADHDHARFARLCEAAG
jgi:hypothetical protein